jgi:hypothetical protein
MSAKNRGRSYRNKANNYDRNHWRKIQARSRYTVSWMEDGATSFDHFSRREEGIAWRKVLETRQRDGNAITSITGPVYSRR